MYWSSQTDLETSILQAPKMAKFNEVLRPRPGLLVIRQTRFEPTLKTLAGLGILGMFAWFSIPLVTSQFFFYGGIELGGQALRSSFYVISTDFRFGTISFRNIPTYSTFRTPV